MRRLIGIGWLCLTSLLLAAPSAPGAVPSGFQDSVAIEGLELPMAFDFAPDGRVFVAEKYGRVVVFDGLDDESPTEFADISDAVYSDVDRGLLGITVDPEFPVRPYVYVLYTHDAEIGGEAPKWGLPGIPWGDQCPDPPESFGEGCLVSGRLSRLTADTVGGELVAGQELVLIEDWCSQFPSHTIGALQFGPDGALYVSGGDGASFGEPDYGQLGHSYYGGNPCGDPPNEGGALRSQDLLTPATPGDPTGLDGTILRVHPDTGEGLSGNPLEGSDDENERRIVAYGFRNPFRFAISAETNEIYTGDVGWNDFEELNRFNPNTGALYNAGWPCYEGHGRQEGYEFHDLDLCQTLYETPGSTSPPFFSYKHHKGVSADDQCSKEDSEYEGSAVSGIAVYDGESFPDSYDGALFFADSVRRCIWVMFAGEDGRPDPSTVATFSDSPDKIYPALDIKVGPDGDLYYLSMFDDEGSDGVLRRVKHFPGNQPPVARLSADRRWGPGDLEDVEFDAGGSTDADDDELLYEWDLSGNGSFSAPGPAAVKTATFTGEENHTVTVRVSDPEGATSIARVTVYPNNTPPEPEILSPDPDSFEWEVGDTIEFTGAAEDGEDGELPATSLDWSTSLQHCPESCHSHLMPAFPSVASGSLTGPEHEYPSHVRLTLKATDSRGLSVAHTVNLHPRTVDLDISANKPGLTLGAGSLFKPAPFVLRAIKGSSIGLAAPMEQMLEGWPHLWQSWQHGGARVQTVLADADASYRANYSWPPEADPAPEPPGLTATAPPSPSNEGSPKLIGTAEAGSTVRVYATADCAGPPLAEGAAVLLASPGIEVAVPANTNSQLRATATLASKTSACSSPRAYLHDSIAPTATIDSFPPALTNAVTASFAFSGADAGSGVAFLQCRLDAGDWETCTSPEGLTGLSAGSRTFAVRAVDNAGNTGAPASFEWMIDTTVPSIQIDSGPEGLTGDATPTFAFTAEAGATVQCSLDTGTPSFGPCSAAGSHTPAAPLPDGPHTFRVRATDAADNSATATRSFTVDSTPPETTIESGPSGTIDDPTPTFAFTASEPGSTFQCSLDTGTPSFGPCSAAGSHTPGSPLADGGPYTFRVRATDAAANTDPTPATRSFTVDTIAPAAPSLTATDPLSPSSSNTPKLIGAAEAGSTVRVYATADCSGEPLAEGAAAVLGSPGIEVSVPADQTTQLRATATDAAQNLSSCSSPLAYTEDSTPPETTIESGPSGTIDDPTPTFAFTASEPGSTFQCSLDTGTPSFGPCSAAGSHTPAAPLPDGPHTFRVRATDAAANTDPTPATRSFTVDTTPLETEPEPKPGPGPGGALDPKLAPGLELFPTQLPLAVRIVGRPLRLGKSRIAKFRFAANRRGARFRCKLDRARFVACRSPRVYRGLRPGRHVFRVTAAAQGLSSAPAVYAWRVVKAPR